RHGGFHLHLAAHVVHGAGFGADGFVVDPGTDHFQALLLDHLECSHGRVPQYGEWSTLSSRSTAPTGEGEVQAGDLPSGRTQGRDPGTARQSTFSSPGSPTGSTRYPIERRYSSASPSPMPSSRIRGLFCSNCTSLIRCFRSSSSHPINAQVSAPSVSILSMATAASWGIISSTRTTST